MTPTPSQTGTVSPTSTLSPSSTYTATPTPAPTPSFNFAALNEAAAEADSSRTATLIGATVGGLVLIIISAFVVYRLVERRRMRDQRLRRMKSFIRNVENSSTVYGINSVVVNPALGGRPSQRLRELRGKN